MFINLMDFIMVCLFIVLCLCLRIYVGHVSRTVSMMDATKLIHNKD